MRGARLVWVAALATLAFVLGAPTVRAQPGAQGRYQLGSKAFVGAPFVLAIVVDGLEEQPTPKLPSLTVPGLEIIEGDADFRGGFNLTVNGRRVQGGGGTWVLTYRVTAEKAGLFNLPAVNVTQGATTVPIRGGNLEVIDLPTTNDMKFAVTLPQRPVYIGETFPVELEWLLRKNPQDQQFGVPLLNMDTTLSVQVPTPTNPRQVLEFATDKGQQKLGFEQDRVTRDGLTYDRFRFPLQVTARKAGPIVIPPASVVVELEIGQGRDAFGFPVARTDTFRATDVQRTLDVRPVPETDKPPSFAGAVGSSYSISARASRSVVQLGEPLELEITVKSDQRLDTVNLPPLDGPGGLPKAKFAAPADAPVGELSDDGKQKTWKVSVQVTAADTTEIPGLAFAYFDPAKATYQTIHSEPIALSVKGGSVVGAAQVVGQPSGSGAPPPTAESSSVLSLAGVDLALSPPGAGGGPMGRGVLWAIVAALYLAPLALLGLALARRRGASRREEVGEVKAALRALGAEIERARQAPAKDAAIALSRCLSTTARALGRTVDDKLIARIENAGFAPDAKGEPLPSELRAELANLLDTWTKDARRGGGRGAAAALVLIVATAWPGAARADEALTAARGAYQDALAATEPAAKQRAFATAAAAFGRVVAARPSAAVYTDLGNAALGAGDLGAAVLAYRRAMALDRDDGRARRNLAWVRSRLPAELRPASTSATETLFFFHAAWSRDRRLLVGAFAFAVAILVLVPWRGARRRSLTPIAVIGGIVWATMTISLVVEDRRASDAVVMQAAELRTADSAVAPVARATPLPAGTELTIGERRGDWVRVHLAGTLSGWLPAGAVERVAR
ncbi:MAG: BatD family protein [Myxococcales bacterium]|nr:BatD family protein [Myxococcales bacterium]